LNEYEANAKMKVIVIYYVSVIFQSN